MWVNGEPNGSLAGAATKSVDVDADRVNVIGIFYGGQEYEGALLEED